jgi:hypothetical protein
LRNKFQLSRSGLAIAALLCLAAFLPAAVPATPLAEIDSAESGAILEKYLKAAKESQDSLRGMSMSIDIRASIPRLDREGGMKATRSVAANGEVSYSGMTFDGHSSIKTDVIARFLQADVEASKQPSIGITPVNYKFKYWGIYGTGDWQLHLFEVTPRRKAPGLFKGWIWVEAKTGLPVREEGRFVKNPSVFLKRWDFARDYDVRSGMARLSNVTSTVLTRIVGEAKATIRYDNYAPTPPAVASVQ